jgi:hypothetical protein
MSLAENVTTLPQPRDGYEVTRFNALRHGLLSKYAVLPWENREEYLTLVEALLAEHKPQGPTEEHLCRGARSRDLAQAAPATSGERRSPSRSEARLRSPSTHSRSGTG